MQSSKGHLSWLAFKFFIRLYVFAELLPFIGPWTLIGTIDISNSNQLERRDYRIEFTVRPTATTAIIAPHGGKIEHGTTELARAIAGDSYNFYCFIGCKPSGNRELHVTSTNFDEPQCLRLLQSCERVVAVHGLAGDVEEVIVGGRDDALRDQIHVHLHRAAFASRDTHQSPDGRTIPNNICNRGQSSQGVQLELTAALRLRLKGDADLFAAFTSAVSLALQEP